MLNEETIDINIGIEENPKLIKVGAWLTQEERDEYKALFPEYFKTSAWLYDNMLGLDHDVVVHNMVVKPNAKPVQ